MSSEYVKAINSQLSQGLDFEKKYIESTINKMLKVELGMVKLELEHVKNSLIDFEERYEMNSDEFYEKFNAGKLGDDRDYIKWYAYKDTFNKLIERSKEIEKVIKKGRISLSKAAELLEVSTFDILRLAKEHDYSGATGEQLKVSRETAKSLIL